jgi:hypothetical protein
MLICEECKREAIMHSLKVLDQNLYGGLRQFMRHVGVACHRAKNVDVRNTDKKSITVRVLSLEGI